MFSSGSAHELYISPETRSAARASFWPLWKSGRNYGHHFGHFGNLVGIMGIILATLEIWSGLWASFWPFWESGRDYGHHFRHFGNLVGIISDLFLRMPDTVGNRIFLAECRLGLTCHATMLFPYPLTLLSYMLYGHLFTEVLMLLLVASSCLIYNSIFTRGLF